MVLNSKFQSLSYSVVDAVVLAHVKAHSTLLSAVIMISWLIPESLTLTVN